ncbi:hypothetical protein Z949_1620 [Sulfitobacter guttiformis KCTC 32187]|nr:hypothetical protein Z949_1620 [Sulfitobacter guttiformis KCTC 32187]
MFSAFYGPRLRAFWTRPCLHPPRTARPWGVIKNSPEQTNARSGWRLIGRLVPRVKAQSLRMGVFSPKTALP